MFGKKFWIVKDKPGHRKTSVYIDKPCQTWIHEFSTNYDVNVKLCASSVRGFFQYSNTYWCKHHTFPIFKYYLPIDKYFLYFGSYWSHCRFLFRVIRVSPDVVRILDRCGSLKKKWELWIYVPIICWANMIAYIEKWAIYYSNFCFIDWRYILCHYISDFDLVTDS